jgi:hypothetical protein
MTETATLPDEFFAMFNGDRLEERLDTSALLSTVGPDGWPHASFLGAGEVLAEAADAISLMLWPHSNTAANLTRNRQAVLFAAAQGSVWEARLALRSAGRAVADQFPSLFRTMVIAVRRHHAPYATVHAMIGFTLLDPQSTVERWRQQVESMRHAD